MARRLAVVDPGKNTGVCIIERRPSFVRMLEWTLWSGPPFEAVQYVEDWLRSTANAAVVCERFTFTSVKHTRQYDALEIIGALRYVANKYATFELQSRSERFRIPLDVAKRFAQPTDDDQESALRHAVVAAVRHGLVDPVTYVVRST